MTNIDEAIAELGRLHDLTKSQLVVLRSAMKDGAILTFDQFDRLLKATSPYPVEEVMRIVKLDLSNTHDEMTRAALEETFRAAR